MGSRWIRPEVYPLFATTGVAVGICVMQLVRNITTNPEVRVTKQNRAAGVLENHDEGKRYSQYGTGASLESLAKGAVCFSRKFTLQEIQDRWTSLLYDPEISAQASARMVEYETELSTSNPAKLHKLVNSKAKDFSFQKRKIESVKNLYYAMRKRVCNEPCNTNDLGFLIAPCSCMAIGGECVCGGVPKPSHDQHVVQNIEPGMNTVSCYGQAGGSYSGAQQTHPEINGHSFHAQHPGSMIKDEDAANNAPYVYSDVQMYDAYTQKVPEPSEVNNVSLRGITDFQDSLQFQQLASSNQCGNEVAESKEMLITDQVGVEHVHFPANNSGEAIWNGVDETNTLTLADGKKIKTANRDPLALQADGGICMPGLDDAAMPEGDYMDFPFFSNSDEFDLLNGENFLNSPHDTNQEDLDDPDTKGVLGADSVMQNMLHPDEANICYDQVDSGHVHHNVEGVSEMILVPTTPEVCYPGPYAECMLNTEDPEIPCNDDASTHGEFSPLRPTASFARNSESPFPPATSSPLKAEHSNASDLVQIKRGDMANAQSPSQPMKLSPSTSEQKEGSVVLNKGCILGAIPSEGPSTSSALMHGNIDTNDESTCMLALPAIHPSGFGEGPSCSLGQHDFFDNSQSLMLFNPVQVPDHMNYNSHDNQSELQDASALQNCMPSHALPDLGLQDPIAAVPASAPPEECLDIENDIPNYYDLEALILDQDLIPWDQADSSHPAVSRFDHPENRKSLIRLEQGARSYVNRGIMSRGAFAVIYGLHLKYYIKDPEVILGRETEDVKVDIDLAKEGRANKISRRQAVIKMDKSGSFHIKNIGKCSIFVNSKEVPSCKGINLSSDSLIEIKEMRLIFHSNQDAVRQYMARTPKLQYSSYQPGF
ncbi:hypothetical protein CFC21_080128 [Triticum aestivum]|uniref:FHA domain-containing protein n=2 Tax=Triticum aestivum TaxID=4565 RepID=A0A9R1I1A9_WHEAT|nr:hypothetical protein CFC21_080128 [Triticum aestivum]